MCSTVSSDVLWTGVNIHRREEADGKDLWFVEQVCLESGMEERGSDGWNDGGDR